MRSQGGKSKADFFDDLDEPTRPHAPQPPASNIVRNGLRYGIAPASSLPAHLNKHPPAPSEVPNVPPFPPVRPAAAPMPQPSQSVPHTVPQRAAPAFKAVSASIPQTQQGRGLGPQSGWGAQANKTYSLGTQNGRSNSDPGRGRGKPGGNAARGKGKTTSAAHSAQPSTSQATVRVGPAVEEHVVVDEEVVVADVEDLRGGIRFSIEVWKPRLEPLAARFAQHMALKGTGTGSKGWCKNTHQPQVDEAAGEAKWLGLTLHPVLAKLYEEAMKETSVDITTVNSELEAAIPSVKKLIQSCLKKGTAKQQAQQQHRRREGPPDNESVEPFIIPDTDPRVPLRGKLGLRARVDIPASTPLYIYRGYMMPQKLYELFLLLEDGFILGEKADIESYTVDSHGEDDIVTSVVGYAFGNQAALVNAPQVNPFEDSKKLINKVGQNCTVGDFFVNTIPVPILVTTAAIQAGEELLYDYGEDYWITLKKGMKTSEDYRKIQEMAAKQAERDR